MFLKDLRYALRTFSQRPGFTAIVVATVALAIGSNVAIFSVVNAVLLRPLPYEDPERLVLVWNRMANANRPNAPVSGPDFLDYREQTTKFEGFAGAIAVEATITGEERPEQVMVGWTTVNLFEVLGVRPIIGRDFEPMSKEEQDKLRKKVAEVAGDGRHELFKTTKNFDGPHHRKQHGFALDG